MNNPRSRGLLARSCSGQGMHDHLDRVRSVCSASGTPRSNNAQGPIAVPGPLAITSYGGGPICVYILTTVLLNIAARFPTYTSPFPVLSSLVPTPLFEESSQSDAKTCVRVQHAYDIHFLKRQENAHRITQLSENPGCSPEQGLVAVDSTCIS